MKLFADEYSFIKYATLELNADGDIDLISVPNKKNVVYAIAVDDVLMYIGKTKNLRKRINYYRTSINRKDQTSDSTKSIRIHDALYEGHKVDFWARQCFNLSMTNELGTISVPTMDLEEPMFIKMFNPPWNTHYREKKK